MNNIKIIKRKRSDGALNEQTGVAQKQIANPVKIRREMSTIISGWVNDWRERKQMDARTAFKDLFEISGV